MQASLFEENAPQDQNLDEVYHEILEKGKIRFPGKTFVFGTGKLDADVVVVGESPGHPDELYGRPFTGPAGELLVKILASIGLRSSDCYLTNVVKFISQGYEMTSDVLAFFTPYLHREMAAISPKVIISLGNTPTRALLGTKKPISQLRGEFFDYHSIKLIPTFNPAYLLRDAEKKKEVWEDMKKVRDYLNSPLARRSAGG